MLMNCITKNQKDTPILKYFDGIFQSWLTMHPTLNGPLHLLYNITSSNSTCHYIKHALCLASQYIHPTCFKLRYLNK